MKIPRIRIEIEFALPGGDQGLPHSLVECVNLVMHQMRESPNWHGEEAGTGHLNYVCHDRTMRCVSARILDGATP